MKAKAFDPTNSRADLWVHLGLGASVLATVVLAVGTMLDFGSNVDAIATRLTVPPPGTALPYLVDDPQSPTNLAARQGPSSLPAPAMPTNAQPTVANPTPHRAAG
jgi:hypothetical protein